MNPLIQQHRLEIQQLCQRYSVRCLELFGSAAREGGFDAATSDFDFLVEFQPLDPGAAADAYFGMLEGLRGLLGRPVDLVMTQAIRNRYFLEAVNQSRMLLYAA